MSSTYLLPCKCGAKVPVESGRAGQSVVCGCGTLLAVPTMREMARLERAEQVEHSAAALQWSGLQGVLFSTGVLVLVVSLLLAAFFGYSRSRLPTDLSPPSSDTEQWAAEKLADATPLETLEIWQMMESEGLGHWHPPPHLLFRQYSADLLRRVLFALAAAGAGAALAASSFFLRSRGAPDGSVAPQAR